MDGEPVSLEVLIVDDSSADLFLTARMFRSLCAPTRIHTARHGDEALASLRREGIFAQRPGPGLIVLDLKLPGMTGHELLKVIKEDPGFRSIPVVVLTTSDDPRERRASLEGGAAAHFVKPNGPRGRAELTAALEAIVLTREPGRRGPATAHVGSSRRAPGGGNPSAGAQTRDPGASVPGR
ncbi:MAG: response regulator [Myxococcota bacterium]